MLIRLFYWWFPSQLTEENNTLCLLSITFGIFRVQERMVMKYFFHLSNTIAIAGMLCFASTASAQNGAVPFENLQSGWHQKTIPVKEGQAKPSIDRLTTAFCEAWRTDVCKDVLLYIKNPQHFKRLYNQDNDAAYDVTIDRANGFAMANDEGGDSPYLFATLWRRSNGHTLLGIHTGKPTDPYINVLLFYDYNPKTRQLVPEKRTSDYLTSKKYGQVEMTGVELPRKGKDVHVSAYGGEPVIEYTFKFNGMDFDEPVIEIQ